MSVKKRKLNIRKFDGFEDAQKADELYYALLPMEKKVEEFLSLLLTHRPDNGKIKRIVLKYPLGNPPKD